MPTYKYAAAPRETPLERLISCLIGIRLLATLEGSDRWRKAIPMIDDAIELATAQNVSIGVSPIIRSQDVDFIEGAKEFIAAQENAPYNTD